MNCKVCNQEPATTTGYSRHGTRAVCAICRRMYFPTRAEVADDDRILAAGLNVRAEILKNLSQ